MVLSNERFAWISATAMAAMIASAVVVSIQSSPNANEIYMAPSLIDETASLPPLFPLSARDYLGYGLAMVGLVIAAGGGIGGGGKT